MNRREIHIILPDRQLLSTTINALVKGQDDCPEEFYYMSIDRVGFFFFDDDDDEFKLSCFFFANSGVAGCLLMSQEL